MLPSFLEHGKRARQPTANVAEPTYRRLVDIPTAVGISQAREPASFPFCSNKGVLLALVCEQNGVQNASFESYRSDLHILTVNTNCHMSHVSVNFLPL